METAYESESKERSKKKIKTNIFIIVNFIFCSIFLYSDFAPAKSGKPEKPSYIYDQSNPLASLFGKNMDF